jgi:hypothetical protein
MVSKEEKIEKVISDLDIEVKNIKEFSNVLARINQLATGIQSLSESVSENAEKYIRVTSQLDESLVMLKQHVDEVSSASEERVKKFQNEGVVKYKKLLEEAIRIIRENERLVLASNEATNKKVETIEIAFKSNLKELNKSVNQGFELIESKLEAIQVENTKASNKNTKILLITNISASIIISALVIYSYFV